MAREHNEKSEQSMEQANENGTVAQTICTSTTAPFSEEASVDADTGAAGAAVVSAADDDDSSTAKLFPREEDREYVSLTDDVYTMFFLSNLFGPGFFYSAYVFALKMALYTFLALDVYKTGRPDMVDKTVLAAQFLMLPVAVAMQEDLIATYYLLSNLKYCPSVRNQSPDATKWKFYAAIICRAIDGVYSLMVNFMVLIAAEEVLTLFLNFAALQFLQTIDNIALDLAAAGYLSDKLERVARMVKQAELPKRGDGNYLKVLDTVFFVATFGVLLVFWILFVVS